MTSDFSYVSADALKAVTMIVVLNALGQIEN